MRGVFLNQAAIFNGHIVGFCRTGQSARVKGVKALYRT